MSEARQKIVYITGSIGSGKSCIAKKLCRDFKYNHICVNTLRKSKNIPATSKIDKELVAEVKSKGPGAPILIEGYLEDRLETLAVESELSPFQYIIHLVCKDETLVARASKSHSMSEQQVRQHINAHRTGTEESIRFYESLGVVTSVHAEADEDTVYEAVKKALLPYLIFFYGAPKTGKTTVGARVAEKIGARFVNMEAFNQRNKHITDKFLVLNAFNEVGRNSPQFHRFLMDDLFETQEQLRILCEELGYPSMIFSFEAPKDEVQKKIREHSKNDSAANEKYIRFVENRPAIQDFIKKNIRCTKINACQTLDQITADVMNSLKPHVLSALASTPDEFNYIKRLRAEKGWGLIQLQQVKYGNTLRKTEIGLKISPYSKETQEVPAKYLAQAASHSIFTHPPGSCVILTQGGRRMPFYQTLEHYLNFPIKLVAVDFKNSLSQGEVWDKDHPYIKYYERGDLIQITEDRIDLLDSKIHAPTKYGLVFGPSASGKTTISKEVAKQYGFTLVEWQPTLAQVKDKYCTEEEKGAEEVPFAKVVKYFQDTFAKNSETTFLFDGFQYQNKFQEFVGAVGSPTFIVNLKLDKSTLIRRTRIKAQGDVNAEVTEEDNQKAEAAIQKALVLAHKGDQFAEKFAHTKSYMLDANQSLANTLKMLERVFSKRVYVVQHASEEKNHIIEQSLANLVKNVGIRNGLAFVDVGQLVKEQVHKHEHSRFHKELKSQYEMGAHQGQGIWPFPYTTDLITRIISSHLAKQDSRDLLIYGYPTSESNDAVYPRSSDQLAAIENSIGSVRLVASITSSHLILDISDPQMHLEKPAAPVIEKKEGQENAEPPAEPVKTEFSIYDHTWTHSDCKPKALAQWYCNLKADVEKNHFDLKSYDDHALVTELGKQISHIKQNSHANVFLEVLKHF